MDPMAPKLESLGLRVSPGMGCIAIFSCSNLLRVSMRVFVTRRLCLGSCGEGGGNGLVSGIVRKLGEASNAKDGLAEVAPAIWLWAVKSNDECLFSSLLDEERDSFDVHPLY